MDDLHDELVSADGGGQPAPLSDARLAEIQRTWRFFDYDYDSAEVDAIKDLLAHVDWLRECEAALLAERERLLAVVRRVATLWYIPLPDPLVSDLGTVIAGSVCPGCAQVFRQVFRTDASGWFTPDSHHAPDCVVMQARVWVDHANREADAAIPADDEEEA